MWTSAVPGWVMQARLVNLGGIWPLVKPLCSPSVNSLAQLSIGVLAAALGCVDQGLLCSPMAAAPDLLLKVCWQSENLLAVHTAQLCDALPCVLQASVQAGAGGVRSGGS